MAEQHIPGTAIIQRNPAMLDIFSEDQLHCKSLAQMRTPIGRCFELLYSDLGQGALSTVKEASPHVISLIERFLKAKGTPVKEILAADMDSLTADIKKKMADGVYELAQSKQIDGNYRAAIIDCKTKKVIKQVTLKQMKMEGQPVNDLNTLAVQAALKNISDQLQVIDAGIQYLIQFARRDSLQTPYFDAMQKIQDARLASTEDQRESDIQKAIDYLEHGLSGLYGDLHDCVTKLGGIKLPIITQRTINYIGEDMVFIPQYVSLLAFLLNFTGRNERARNVLRFYQKEVAIFTTTPMKPGGLPAAQLVHAYCKYGDNNLDFWLDGMTRVNRELSSLPVYTENTHTPVYLLSWEDEENGVHSESD